MLRPRVTFATPRLMRDGLISGVQSNTQSLTEAAALAVATAQEAGKRHSHIDQSALNEAFGALVNAGAVCPLCEAGHVCESIPAEEAQPALPDTRITEAAPGRFIEALTAPLSEAVFDAVKGEVTLTIIRPGFNATQSRYYTPAAVTSIVEAMRGRKMYLDHATPTEQREQPERSVKDIAAVLTETWTAPDGSGKGKATLIHPEFRALVEGMARAGLLPQLGASINAVGTGEKAMLEGVETFRVTAIDAADPFRSVDWVTEPGAGGRAELLEAIGQPATIPLSELTAMQTAAVVDELTQEPPLMDEDNQEAVTPAPAADDDAEDRKLIKQMIAAHDTRMGELHEALQGMAGRMDALHEVMGHMARAHGLQGLLGQFHEATDAVKQTVLQKLLAGTGDITAETVQEAIAAETPVRPVRGFGGTGSTTTDATPKDVDTILRETFTLAGLTGEALEIAIRGR